MLMLYSPTRSGNHRRNVINGTWKAANLPSFVSASAAKEEVRMGEILGIRCSHGTCLVSPLNRGSHDLRQHLEEDETPAHLKDPKSWPEAMQKEWADDQGLAHAKKYQEILQPAYRRARQAIDEFNPDFVLIFGDDQYGCLLEDLLL